MPFGIIILMRVLFAASMVFIIGYVFGSFSKNPRLTTITKVASVLVIALFISINIFAFRFTGSHWRYHRAQYNCGYYPGDTTLKR
jgi:hypothetical protein